MVIQFIDNHYLIPRIVASKIQVNALVAIVGVLVGNAIGGVAGMFLALPVIAILKIIFDRIEPLKPWGMVLGDEETPARPQSQPAPKGCGARKGRAEERDRRRRAYCYAAVQRLAAQPAASAFGLVRRVEKRLNSRPGWRAATTDCVESRCMGSAPSTMAQYCAPAC